VLGDRILVTALILVVLVLLSLMMFSDPNPAMYKGLL